ncbi:MAG: tRNA lysidine(34) synthetase TilS [Treponema sp.]|nr:tRNA lysidine(34) synthetase TilS [Treponema sp.]
MEKNLLNHPFVQKVKESTLEILNEISSKQCVGVAVSGGADSVALLISLCSILKEKKLSLYVITVNHAIRSKEESARDVEFVKKMCETLSSNDCKIFFTEAALGEGEVSSLAKKRGFGIEEAARFLRYQKFDEFILQNNLSTLFLAHTKNDNLETILMHFLQGSFAPIQKKRSQFFRPLLDITRNEIEAFLNENNFTWMEDSTNGDTSYFRNRIRHCLIPVLDENFSGWTKAVLSGNEKINQDVRALWESAKKIEWQKNDKKNSTSIFILKEVFARESFSVKCRLFYNAFSILKIGQRVPYSFVKRVCNALDSSDILYESANGVLIFTENEKIIVKKNEKLATDFGFSVIIEESGLYNFPFGKVSVQKCGTKLHFVFLENELHLEASFPLCVRSKQIGDKVKMQNGNFKNVSDVFSDWKVKKNEKDFLPIIQNVRTQEIVCLWGSVFGYDNWICKN